MISVSASNILSPQASQKKRTENEDEEDGRGNTLNQNIYHDELLDEFLDTQMYDDPVQITNEILRVDTPKAASNSGVGIQSPQGKALFMPKQQLDQQQGFFPVDSFQPQSQMSTPSSFDPIHAIMTATEQNSELQRYQNAKNELMKLKFGGKTDDDDNDDMESGDGSVSDSSFKSGIPESSEMCRSPVPTEYLTIPSSKLPYQLQVLDLPSYSRVETQIKLKLSVSPAPSQYLLHFPRDTIAKPKLTLKDSEIPESIQSHVLFLDSFVVGSDATENMANMQSFNVCRKCMRRELKRASRRKSNSADKSCGWSLDTMKRAIIFNCKEVVSFPQPSADPECMAQRNMEVFSRIVCYCRHHQESKGFRLFFVLKDHTGKILGKTLSNTIMIMDRKKSAKVGGRRTLSSKTSPLSGTSADDSKASVSALSENSSDYLSTGASARSLNASFSFRSSTAAPPSYVGVGSKARSAKRQKRSWSSNDRSSTTYFDGVSQPQRNTNSGSVSSTTSVKREANSPLSSDTLSPQNNMYMSSATSVFSTTPEKNSLSVSSSTPHGVTTQQVARSQIGSQQAAAMRTSLSNVSSSTSALLPCIQRIIPAQGPIRGGVEVTLLGTNFRPGMGVKFGANLSLATHWWSDSTLVTYLPPAAQAGPVLVTIQDPATGEMVVSNPTSHQIFTYTDDSDRQLIELALQIVGLKMNGRLEDAENIAKRIIGSSHDGGLGGSVNGSMSGTNDVDMGQTPMGNSGRSSWLTEASNRIKQFSKGSGLDQQDIIVRFLSLLDLPNSPVVSPNWAICTLEGQTVLHLACLKGYFKLARYLIEHGAKVDPRDANNLTPLHYSLIYGHRDLIILLSRCKASTSQTISERVTLKDIADSNVLDLLESAVSGNLSREESIDSLYSLNNEPDHCLFRASDSARAVTESTIHRRNVKFFASDSEIEADSEDNTDYSISEMSTEVNNASENEAITNELAVNASSASALSASTSVDESSEPAKKHGKNIGLQFWMAMRDALNFGVDNTQQQDQNDEQNHVQSTSDDATMTVVDETFTLVDDRKTDNTTVVDDPRDDEILPSYDDLFPNGGNWKSFINFGGKERKELVTTSTSENESDPQSREEEVEEALISLKSKQRLNSDKRLMFFWLPFMLLLLCIVVGSRLNIVSLNRFPAASKIVEGSRDFLGSVMLGKDRFTDLLNENWSFGRERVNKVFNDMNDAMMTAVGGAR